MYDIETNQKIELLKCLEDKFFLENELEKEAKIRVRIICQKLTEGQSMARRRKD